MLLTAQGQPKITDFGLAALADKSRLTKTGMSMGTPAYMSPEQAQGKQPDHRTDIWSLGVVFYEMVTGRVPFGGGVEAAVANAILTQEPEPMTALRTGLPVELDRIVSKALAKNPAERYQHVEDMLVDLRTAKQHPGVKQTSVKDKKRVHRLVPLAAAVGGAAIALLWSWLWKQESRIATSTAPRKFEVASAMGLQRAVISPNGQMIAYVKDNRIWIRQMDSLQPREIAGAEGSSSMLFWSPDSLYLGYIAGLNLRKVSAQGGPAVQLSKLPASSLGAAWSAEGYIVVGLYRLGLFKVPAEGGQPTLLVKPDPHRMNTISMNPVSCRTGQYFVRRMDPPCRAGS
ncbi:MAG: protein kinase [Acidobacteriia bacterium]|nr:protein kinase [Terriglobia bacterium]